MSQRGKNASIFSFFQPVPRPQGTANPSRASTATAATQTTTTPTPSRSPTPLPPSSPFSQRGTPPKSRRPLRRDFEVKDSDDDGDDSAASSDESLEDLSAILGRHGPSKPVPSPSRPRQNPLATPKAKRTAVAFHCSPLAIIPKHKFDLKALAKDARKDDATHASSMRVKDAAKQDEDVSDVEMSRNAFEGIVKEEGGHDAQKVLRAVRRTEGGHSSLRYHFFEQDYHSPRSSTPPRKFSKGPWKVLTQGGIAAREQHLASGLPLTLLHLQGSLPNELFNWVLDELCVQKSSLMRLEYCNLLAECAEQIEEIMTVERLEESFLRLGASNDLKLRDADLALSKSWQDPYENRDWGNLKSFLTLLRCTTPYMALPSVTYAAQILLRMSVDTVVMHNIDLLVEYEGTIQALLEAVPHPSWDSFCFDACSDLHRIVQAQSLRINVLACFPVSTAEVHDLRRRLAVTFLYDDPSLSRHHPNNTVSMKGLIDRLGDKDFTVGPNTDFSELRACILLLNIAVDDGSFVVTDDPEDEKAFNEDVDELAARLRGIWRKINDAGMKLARTETKAVIEWVQQRLSHSVRTRRKAKNSVFDLGGRKEDPFLPRQQDYMKSFLKKRPKGVATPVDTEASSAGGSVMARMFTK